MATDEPKGKGKGRLEEAETEAMIGHADTVGSTEEGNTDVEIRETPVDTAATLTETDLGTTGEPSATTVGEGSKVGRFTVLRKLGEGGMGVVLAAYDPVLDRSVALKLLRPRSLGKREAEHARKRLIREARAMAKLAHPNVIPVFDAGEIGDQVFIAMLFVDGETVGEWTKREKRTWREVLDVYLEAGKGLAAAHQAGLVHRDFKPDNVLVGKDGRVRVTDFGLVRAAAPSADSAESDSLGPSGADMGMSPELVALTQSLTKTGQLVGTPLYMAPEQHLRGETDTRTDQFGFCSALFEALYGVRPFKGTSYRELLQHVVEGDVSDPPEESEVPSWVREILLRGLSVKKDERYPSMEALIEALESDPAVVRRRRLTVAAVAALILILGGLAVSGLFRGKETSRQLCKGSRQKLAGVWDEDRKAAVERTFRETGRAYAGGVYARVEQTLDGYAAAWVESRTEACEATHLLGEQSEEALDLRMACLEQGLREMRALTALFVDKPDTGVLDKAIQGALALPSMAKCSDVEALRAPFASPDDPAKQTEVDSLREELARAETLLRAGKYADAHAKAERAVESAAALGYQPLDAEAWLVLGMAQEEEGTFAKSRESLSKAFTAGFASKHDAVVTDAAVHLVKVVGDHLEEHQRGLQWAAVARAALERTGTGGDLTEAKLLENLGALRMRMGEYAKGLERHQEALEILRRAVGDEHPLVAASEHSLGVVLEKLGRYDEALAHDQRALAVIEKALGPEHPTTGVVMNSVGNLQSINGDHDAAIVTYRRAAEIMEKSLGPEHPNLGVVYNNIGIEQKLLGKLDEAIATHQKGLAIREKALGAEHPDVGASLANIAEVYREKGELESAVAYDRRALRNLEAALDADHPYIARVRGNLAANLGEQGNYDEAQALLEHSLADLEKKLGPEHDRVALVLSHMSTIAQRRGRLGEALKLGQRALAIYEAALGPDNPEVAESLVKLGEVFGDRGEHDEARRQYERALSIAEKSLGPEHAFVAEPLTGLADEYRQLGRDQDAIAAGERAVRIMEAEPGDPFVLARSRFALARALVAGGGDRKRALALAEQARATYDAAGERGKRVLAEVTAWLEKRRVE